jgi:hypothetical protein
VSTLAPSAITGAFQAFWYVSGTFQPNMCAASGTFLPFDRCCAVLPAAALQPCTLPGALPHAAAVDALHYMLCNPPVHPLSSCSSPKDRLCTASVLSFILTLFFPLRSHFSVNHPDEPHLDSKATGGIPCLRQRRRPGVS